jgi:hypothetical protein
MDTRDPGDYAIEDYEDLFSIDRSEIGAPGVPDKPEKIEQKSLWGHSEIKSLNYTKPEVRERIKRRIMAGDKGGRPGQWSARKAQLLAQEYRKAGGGYRGGIRKTQRSLKRWTREKWTTSDGKPANRPGGMRRYLPAKAWSRLTPTERRATNRKKIEGSRRGNQFVRNTQKARTVGRNVRKNRSS